ncbi:MAG: IS1634 family transposase [Methylococcales bacterium]|nr:IS1634 family transposase [Methylococcales bacterium]
MYIRRTKTKSLDDGGAYYTYRIVESVRLGKQVKQRTLLNLGKDFAIDSEHWTLLTARIEQLLEGSEPHQQELFHLADDLTQLLEASAQRYSTLIIAKLAQPVNAASPEPDYHTVDINHVEALQTRSIGVESLAWHAILQLQLDQKLTALGFNKVELAAAVGSIIGRVVSPGSELHTHDWLQSHSALGELLDHDYGNTSLTRLYTISDKLLKHQTALETFLSDQEQTLFDLNRSIVLYDLTNTYFEGQCSQNPKAQFGRSKEKRSDCPLVTLGLVLDGEGFPLSSRIFPGNASEPGTLELMLDGLQEKNPLPQVTKPVIIMDAGIASADNIVWLTERGYLYLVVSRERAVKNPRDLDDAVMVRETEHSQVCVYSETDAETKETRLYCHSEQKQKKEQGIRNRFHVRMEEALNKLDAGLNKKGTVKKYTKILERIGRLREKNRRVSQDYRIEVMADEEQKNAIRIEWELQPQSAQKDQHCGVYCLRTNIPDWSEEQLWTTYIMLTEIEATFRSLKSELGLRPVYHQKEERVTGHLFITLLAYHLVHTLRYQLKQQGIHLSWESIRNIMSTQQRITLTLPTDDHKMIHLRTTTKAEVRQKKIYDALNIKPDLIGKYKTIIDKKNL